MKKQAYFLSIVYSTLKFFHNSLNYTKTGGLMDTWNVGIQRNEPRAAKKKKNKTKTKKKEKKKKTNK